ncbi:MAG: peptidylprolyl isomerase [Halieaceae bacterium]
MKPGKITATIILCLTLAGCFQTNLGGSTGATALDIARLRATGNVLATGTTLSQADWINASSQQAWDEINPLTRLLLIGVALLDTQALDPDALYLVTATGGSDYDPETSGSISDSPETVQGLWHAIATGQRIMDGNIQVSALSEASYRQVAARLNNLTDAQIIEQMDAAARLMVTDIDADGDVDHSDVLRWNRTLHAGKYLGEISAIDALATALRAGQPADMLDTMAADVLGKSRVTLQTNFGSMELETLNWEAPLTADNFLRYVTDNFYDNIVFHRTINNFIIQAGIWELQAGSNVVAQKDTRAPIRNESRYSVSNQRGTLAMARTNDPDSASSQFFVNQVDNSFLDFGSSTNPDGYTVFARVITGLEVVDAIAALPTGFVSGIGSDVPSQLVLIESTTLNN